jgi:hypothetical protein
MLICQLALAHFPNFSRVLVSTAELLSFLYRHMEKWRKDFIQTLFVLIVASLAVRGQDLLELLLELFWHQKGAFSVNSYDVLVG